MSAVVALERLLSSHSICTRTKLRLYRTNAGCNIWMWGTDVEGKKGKEAAGF